MSWDAYLTTIVTLVLADRVVVVSPADGPPSGDLPAELAIPIHVVTAWNPGSRPLDRAENAARNAALEAELRGLGVTWHPAHGCSPDGSWCEDSVALSGWRREDACALGRRHGQAAVFELRPSRLLVVSTDLQRIESRPCTVTSRPAV